MFRFTIRDVLWLTVDRTLEAWIIAMWLVFLAEKPRRVVGVSLTHDVPASALLVAAFEAEPLGFG
jgi:hypothetical protein